MRGIRICMYVMSSKKIDRQYLSAVFSRILYTKCQVYFKRHIFSTLNATRCTQSTIAHLPVAKNLCQTVYSACAIPTQPLIPRHVDTATAGS